ncbi:1-aminocyclopropane-1-carboxylate oxidase 2 [Hondaea fermentalgiana]|uniref:1-aminocyclopropane-1-carboxylate oxidase 2 n=1 Tax=Hondaea fermentalgiana TaxID=2315210 RepID=A0A2R5GR07_9STRA|nr:1-aminocyclopropane-1-carboxylate oxidase 2 [Hondaea fermentalgiana]|eukprot:GBG33312.1 1-aminocyclopropane-1-carboxylate oxidase 2 [Hondaea fermentalgiana]
MAQTSSDARAGETGEADAHGVPVVDVSSFATQESLPVKPEDLSEDQRATVQAWGDALTRTGFAVVVEHGIADDDLRAAFDASKRFFLELPSEEKLKYNYGPYGTPQGGYTPQGIEGVGRSLDAADAPADLVESYVFNAAARANPDNHEPVLFKNAVGYSTKATWLMHVLHCISAFALDLPGNFFDEFHTNPDSVMRCACYPPLDKSKVEGGSIRYSAHTDYQGFTILALEASLDGGPTGPTGLQVNRDGEWKDVVLPTSGNPLVTNIGDLWQVWTAGRWKSTLHRVMNPPADSEAAKRYRFSLPYFTGPNAEANIVPIDGSGEAVNAGEYLRQKLDITNV